MRQFLSTILAATVFIAAQQARGDDAKPVLDKAITALGGASKLGAAKAYSWKSKGKLIFGGNENDFSGHVTIQGLDHFRQEFEGEFNGSMVKGVTVIAGDKGWRKFGEETRELSDDDLANQKRTVYLMLVPMSVLPVTKDGFKIGAAADEKVGDKPAVAVKLTARDGKDFTLYFDKSSGLPIKQVATVIGRDGNESEHESTFADYKDFDGIKRATKLETKRNGEKFLEQQLTDFKALDKVDPGTFAKPE